MALSDEEKARRREAKKHRDRLFSARLHEYRRGLSPPIKRAVAGVLAAIDREIGALPRRESALGGGEPLISDRGLVPTC